MIHSMYVAPGPSGGSRLYSGIALEFGAQVRQMRREHNLSDVELACRAGVTRAHLQDIEEGCGEVDLLLLSRLADGLGVPMSELVELL